MTSLAETEELACKLITAVTGETEEGSSSNFKIYKNLILPTLRSYKYSRTDHFAVREQLDGLEEKFRVKDRDEIADELHQRRHEYESVDFKFKPELLHLLLELSDNPVPSADSIVIALAQLTLEQEELLLAHKQRIASEEQVEFENDDEGIWDVPDFTASSDDSDWEFDEFAAQAQSKPKKAKRSTASEANAEDVSYLPIDKYVTSAYGNAIRHHEISQYWIHQTSIPVNKTKDFRSYGYTESEVQDLWIVGEINVIREVVFALYGLPSSLFEFQDNGSINVVSKYVLIHTSPGSLNNILDHFATKAVMIQKLRTYAKLLEHRCELAKVDPPNSDAVAPKQTFVDAIQKAIIEWEIEVLVPAEESYVIKSRDGSDNVIISLLQFQQLVDDTSDRFVPLYEIVTELERNDEDFESQEPAERVSRHLELLFRKACEAESNGQSNTFAFLKSVLVPCLRTYLRPISKWMETGEIRQLDGLGAFFVHPAEEEAEEWDTVENSKLATLWEGHYILDRDDLGHVAAPSFIREYGKRIFVTGKSVLFLRKLEVNDFLHANVSAELEKALAGVSDCQPSEESRTLTSFNDALHVAISQWVDEAHKTVSSKLRDVLYYDCGLWDSLEAIIDIYFMRDGFAITSFCATLFERIDKGNSKWDDRFLLTELMQSVSSDNYGIDISRLSIRSKRQEMTKTAVMVAMQKQNVKLLNLLVIDYRLSWPIMNIIGNETIEICKKVWSFLLMIRKGRNVLEKMRLAKHDNASVNKLVYTIRWRLLTFISLLHTYLVDLVIRPQTESMKLKLAEALDIDEMIDVQYQHFGRIADMCLLSVKLAPLYQAVISMLELSVLFAKEQNIKQGLSTTYDISNRSIRNISIGTAPWQKGRNKRLDSETEDEGSEVTSGDEDDRSDTSGHENSDEDGQSKFDRRRRRKERIDANNREMLMKFTGQVDKLILFLTSGLRSMARAGVYPETIEILAERLEMGVMVKYRSFDDEV